MKRQGVLLLQYQTGDTCCGQWSVWLKEIACRNRLQDKTNYNFANYSLQKQNQSIFI